MRRAVPLHYTDVGYGEHTVKQKQFRQLFEWIPYFRSHNMSWDREYVEKELGRAWTENDEFSFQCAMAPAVTYMTWWDADDGQYKRTIAAEKLWRRAADLMLRGDYEPLTECRKDPGDWYAMRFDDGGEGFVQVIRNRAAEADSFTVTFRADPEKTYLFEDVNGGPLAVTGREIREKKGIAVILIQAEADHIDVPVVPEFAEGVCIDVLRIPLKPGTRYKSGSSLPNLGETVSCSLYQPRGIQPLGCWALGTKGGSMVSQKKRTPKFAIYLSTNNL